MEKIWNETKKCIKKIVDSLEITENNEFIVARYRVMMR